MNCIACGVPGAGARHCCEDAPVFCEKCFDEHQKITHEYKDTCHDCGVQPGEAHDSGCDVERCSVCKGQWISCGCEDHDPEQSKWTGLWPGIAECRELGFWCVERPGTNHPLGGWFWPCTKDYPGAREDLNRWARFSQTGEDPYPPGTELLGQ